MSRSSSYKRSRYLVIAGVVGTTIRCHKSRCLAIAGVVVTIIDFFLTNKFLTLPQKSLPCYRWSCRYNWPSNHILMSRSSSYKRSRYLVIAGVVGTTIRCHKSRWLVIAGVVGITAPPITAWWAGIFDVTRISTWWTVVLCTIKWYFIDWQCWLHTLGGLNKTM